MTNDFLPCSRFPQESTRISLPFPPLSLSLSSHDTTRHLSPSISNTILTPLPPPSTKLIDYLEEFVLRTYGFDLTPLRFRQPSFILLSHETRISTLHHLTFPYTSLLPFLHQAQINDPRLSLRCVVFVSCLLFSPSPIGSAPYTTTAWVIGVSSLNCASAAAFVSVPVSVPVSAFVPCCSLIRSTILVLVLFSTVHLSIFASMIIPVLDLS